MSRLETVPSSPSDPLITLQRRTRRAVITAGLIVVAAGVFCWWPVSVPPIEALGLATEPPPINNSNTPQPFDIAAFDTPVWIAPPPPVAPTEVAKTLPLPPLKLELLGILRDGDAFRAVVYDPDTDKVTVLGSGDTLAGRTVTRVTADTVAIRDDSGTRTLTLKTASTGGDG